jgi:Xaa-Pro aminopeptidase
MDEAKIRILVQISDEELNRRWAAVRREMAERKIDYLIMRNTNQHLGGYVKWFTDVPAFNGYPMTVIFPREGEMTTINPGPKMNPKSAMTDLSTRDWAFRGVKNRWTAPYFTSLHYSRTYDAELIVNMLKAAKGCTVGFVGLSYMPIDFYNCIVNNLPQAKCVDATDFVDEIKAIKSPEEIGLILKCAEMQDKAMAEVLKNIKPGLRDSDVMAIAQYSCEMQGSEEQLIMCGSAPLGIPSPMLKRHFMNRELRKGDHLTLMIEASGPGGFYCELSRIFVLGKSSAELSDALEMAKETQKVTLRLLKPGADPKEMVIANNEFLKSKGFPEEMRLYAHGQGYDLVERPAIRDDEPMIIRENMSITVHPIVATPTVFAWICDNYLVTKDGISDCIHATPQKILEVGV